MAPRRSTMADKNIVDRTKAHRNADLARTVRETRDRLSQQPGNPAFDREMLRLHAGALTGRAAVLPVLAGVVAAAGLVAGMGPQVAFWAVLTAVAYAGLGLFAAHIAKREAGDIDVASVRILLLGAHAVTGLCWTWFALLSCESCQIDQFATVKGVVLLFAVAATAILAYALRGALLATFGLPVVAYIGLAVNLWNPVDAAMAGLLAASLPFFSYIAGHLHRSAVMLLSFRTEKDGLIAELETAKSISDEARRRAEEANLAKSRFLASMSHELRTPLNAILGFSEVMAEQVLGPLENETYRDYARSIHDSGHHLLALINEILDISRIEAGRYKLKEEPVDIANTVEDCCNMVELKARNKDLHIAREFEPALPPLFADERAVRQITLNLLSNAIKFAPTGGEIRVRAGWTTGGGQYISVRDNGPGIPAEEIPVVLSAFGQGSIAIKSAEQGTGLGLPIVQGLLEIHGGRFELRSKLRLGTEATAIFPAARVMAPLAAARPRAGKASAA
ncbi:MULTISPECIES: sensor histidine kinase [Nitratireductor]|uniref:sensor histidine kinase n=1 Tax=Nitratireductor TaxID=245876 RepID=UPI000D0E19D2|nr:MULTISPECIES: HAMP domain-containing sensor histidine kinase [Nitratireductor]PSM20077.1 two-component sensor histidine kinase [Nitratireductor sp. StC3]